MNGYEVASLDEHRVVPVPGTLRWTPLRKHFGITAFGINAYTATERRSGRRRGARRGSGSGTRRSTSSSPAGRRSCSTATRSTSPRARSSSSAIRR